jgi:hypothetical protein
MQARWPREQVRIEGDPTEYVRISDEGDERSYFFCPRCGATVYYWSDPERIAVPVGAFADPNFPAPRISVWEDLYEGGRGLDHGGGRVGVVSATVGWPVPISARVGGVQEFELGLRRLIPYRGGGGRQV